MSNANIPQHTQEFHTWFDAEIKPKIAPTMTFMTKSMLESGWNAGWEAGKKAALLRGTQPSTLRDATKRIEDFLNQRAQIQELDQQIIATLEGGDLELRTEDLRLLLAHQKRLMD